MLRKLPALIHGSGLGQTLAFLRAKQGNDGEKSHAHVYTILSDWLCQSNNKGCVFTGGNPNDALQAIAHGNMRQYMAAQNEALALLDWLVKLAQALLAQPDGQGREEGAS